VCDKGYFSRETVKQFDGSVWKTRIAEPNRKGLNWWSGDHEARRAVYNNRARIASEVGKAAVRRRTELVERSFEHCLDRCGGMRRAWLRGADNVEKRYLIHVAGFNLGVLMRKQYGVATPREAAAREILVFCASGYLLVLFLMNVGAEDRIDGLGLAA
jgi:hypothetical protein